MAACQSEQDYLVEHQLLDPRKVVKVTMKKIWELMEWVHWIMWNWARTLWNPAFFFYLNGDILKDRSKSSNIALQDGYMNLMRLPEQVLMSSSFRFWSLVELSCTWRNSRKPPRNPLCSSQFHNSPLLNMEHFISVFHTRLIHYRVESDLQYRSGTVIYLINAHNHSDLILFLSILAFLFF